MCLVLSLPFHIAQAQYPQQARQLWPPGKYCGFIGESYVGVTVHPAQPNDPPGKFKVSTSAVGNKTDWGSYKYTERDVFYPIVLNAEFKPEIQPDGTVNLINSRGAPVYTGLRYEDGQILGGKRHLNDQTLPANFGSCTGFKPEVMRWLFDTPGFYRSERYAPQRPVR